MKLQPYIVVVSSFVFTFDVKFGHFLFLFYSAINSETTVILSLFYDESKIWPFLNCR